MRSCIGALFPCLHSIQTEGGVEMRENDGQADAHISPAGRSLSPGSGSARANRHEMGTGAREPSPPDVLGPVVGDAVELDPLALRFPGTRPDIITPEWVRFQARQLIKEFLSAVPRSEPDTTLSFLRPDGTTRILTRAQLSAAVDFLRPRQRQIVRLAVEERWPYKRVCVYLNHISLRTVERDLAEALDLLAHL